MEDKLSDLKIDASPLAPSQNDNENKCAENVRLNSVLHDFTEEQFKSVFFLLMDYIKDHNFFDLTKQDKFHLREKFDEIYRTLSENVLIELLGTMKMFGKLKKLGVCSHVFEKLQETKFNHIDRFWKMLYSICDYLNYDDLEILKHLVPSESREKISEAEDWFFWAFEKDFFSKSDLSFLKKIFHNYPVIMKKIEDFEAIKELYYIKTPTKDTDCGIALILNYEKFDDEEKFEKRSGSESDVHSLVKLWQTFGFKTETRSNLSHDQTNAVLKYYARLDHSMYDAFVCCILSHGRSNSVISSDCLEMPIPNLIAGITNNCNHSLISKPKLFFIQACQGTNIHQGPDKPIYPLDLPEVEKVAECKNEPPKSSDVFIAVSSIPGFVSFRHVEEGSFFINSLCKSMVEYGDKKSILEVMIDVNRSVRQKDVYLGPGLPRSAQQIVNCSNAFCKNLIFKKRVT